MTPAGARRFAIVGNAGSGKSTLAAALAGRLGVLHVELDAIFHLPGWTELPVDEFRAKVTAATAGDGWVVDGNYTIVRDIVWRRADTVVWLDFPRRLVMSRVVRRSLARVLTRRQLWNGNRERLRNLVSMNPEQSIIRWAWTRHGVYHARFRDASADPAWTHLTFVRLRSPREAKAFLAATGPVRS